MNQKVARVGMGFLLFSLTAQAQVRTDVPIARKVDGMDVVQVQVPLRSSAYYKKEDPADTWGWDQFEQYAKEDWDVACRKLTMDTHAQEMFYNLMYGSLQKVDCGTPKLVEPEKYRNPANRDSIDLPTLNARYESTATFELALPFTDVSGIGNGVARKPIEITEALDAQSYDDSDMDLAWDAYRTSCATWKKDLRDLAGYGMILGYCEPPTPVGGCCGAYKVTGSGHALLFVPTNVAVHQEKIAGPIIEKGSWADARLAYQLQCQSWKDAKKKELGSALVYMSCGSESYNWDFANSKHQFTSQATWVTATP